ncbi:arginyltransferase [Candidatus Uabimicrobium sp. HlEnr_7]|uniref:arginyltransferase n=1 Tax=Candidatus Uabimicrobium helgolandensis TaxID=3095367 RepID=UPI003558BD1E
MILLQEKRYDDLESCTYLPKMQKRFEYFFAHELDEYEIAHLLENGWRKFGMYFFRPRCPGCQACIPTRVLVQDFKPSKSQKRVLKKNIDVEVCFSSLRYDDRIFELYKKHSQNRFSQTEGSKENFLHSFYLPSCPGLQSEFYLNGKLIGAGFLDKGHSTLSSIYFVYDTDYQHLNLGTFSILKEIEYAKKLDNLYYYLGYYIEKCTKMAYKNKFNPQQHFNWQTKTWTLFDRKSDAKSK